VKVKMAADGDNPGGERVLTGTDVILATGSRVKSLPGLEPDGKRIVTSDDVLTSNTLPKDVIVVGAGAVGVEFASMYQDLGVKVTLLEYLPGLVPLEDREVSQALERSFTRRGMTVMTNARFDPKAVKVTKTGVSVDVGPEGKEASTLTAELMLVATGRAPNVENVGLETTKAELERGFVKVDSKTMRTRVPHLYAIGDVIGGLMLAHTAGHEGLLAAHTIAGDRDTHPMDYVQQPRATYCRPEIASVGLTEQQCKEQGLPYKVGKVPFQAIAKAIIGGEYEGFAKVIGNTETGDTLGVHVIGPHATDLISEATLAFTSRRRRGRSAARRTPTRPSPRSSARPRSPSTAVDQLLRGTTIVLGAHVQGSRHLARDSRSPLLDGWAVASAHVLTSQVCITLHRGAAQRPKLGRMSCPELARQGVRFLQ
jgi:dihydrolipoamide dehydrogenase